MERTTIDLWFGAFVAAGFAALLVLALKVGNLGFAGFARETGMLQGVTPPPGRYAKRFEGLSWEAMVESWRVETARLGDGFASGAASVDPKNKLATCERCDLQPLCRVHERVGTLDEGDDEVYE